MSLKSAVVFFACLCLSLAVSSHAGDDEASGPNPLAEFERIIGGQWQLEGSYQEFEWGVGQRSVRGRSYFIVNGEPRLVSEGLWYWHPGERKIKGVFTARDMPVDLFDYTTRFEDDRMISELVAYGADGNKMSYVETWEFTDASHFTWILFRDTPEGPEKEMGGVYTRTQNERGP